MNVTGDQIEFKKKVGKVRGKDLWHIKTKGGLHIVADGSGSVLGTGPHRLVARHIAQKSAPDAEWTELSKQEHIDQRIYQHLLPEYESLTAQMQALQAARNK
jgi:hypothetical protein